MKLTDAQKMSKAHLERYYLIRDVANAYYIKKASIEHRAAALGYIKDDFEEIKIERGKITVEELFHS